MPRYEIFSVQGRVFPKLLPNFYKKSHFLENTYTNQLFLSKNLHTLCVAIFHGPGVEISSFQHLPTSKDYTILRCSNMCTAIKKRSSTRQILCFVSLHVTFPRKSALPWLSPTLVQPRQSNSTYAPCFSPGLIKDKTAYKKRNKRASGLHAVKNIAEMLSEITQRFFLRNEFHNWKIYFLQPLANKSAEQTVWRRIKNKIFKADGNVHAIL